MVPWNRNVTQTEVEEDFSKGDKNTELVQEESKKEKPSSANGEPIKNISLSLGSYRGTIVPLSILFFGYTCGAISVSSLKPDPRVQNWFLLDSSVNCLALCILYILFSIVWGPNLMKERKPLKLKSIMRVYNVGQVLLSLYIFVEVGLCGWFFDYNYNCQACDYSHKPKALRMASVGWLFYISKVIDFIDTMFFVLNKKWSHVSLLHVVHHSCMCMSMWYGISYIPGGHITFMGFLNSGVHTIMYTYYFLSSFGPGIKPYLWWKKYLTTIQLVQFVAIFLHAAQLLVIDCPSVPIGLAIWTCIYAFIFFALFIDFYSKAYLKPSKKTNPSNSQNRASENTNSGSAHQESFDGKNKQMRSSIISNSVMSHSTLYFRIASCLSRLKSLQQ